MKGSELALRIWTPAHMIMDSEDNKENLNDKQFF